MLALHNGHCSINLENGCTMTRSTFHNRRRVPADVSSTIFRLSDPGRNTILTAGKLTAHISGKRKTVEHVNHAMQNRYTSMMLPYTTGIAPSISKTAVQWHGR